MPDIDVDFCFERRDEVIRYVREKYGADRVAQIITFGTLKGKAAIKDVGRVLDFTFGETDRIAKLYPGAEAGEGLPARRRRSRWSRGCASCATRGEREGRLFDLALRLEGLLRHASKHAAGIVIAPQPLTDDLPLWVDKDGAVVTQYTFTDVEAIGLIKFDFLGLKTLTLIAEHRAPHPRGPRRRRSTLDELPLDDAPTYKLLAKRRHRRRLPDGVRRHAPACSTQLRPRCFEDLVAALALYRPGPLDSGMVERLHQAQARQGADHATPHPALEPILRETYGVIVYQEQVMQIAQALAGYSLGDADNLRRAMGKKKAEEMAKERERFLDGRAAQRTTDGEARGDDLRPDGDVRGLRLQQEPLGRLRAHHLPDRLPEGALPDASSWPALLSLEAGDTDNTYKNIAECREHGIAILPPDVNESREDFTVAGEAIRFGLGAVKGVGSKAIEIDPRARATRRAVHGPRTTSACACAASR